MASPLEPGDVIAHHQVLREFGRGTMSVVYLARHLDLERLAVIKLMLSSDPELAERFDAEHQALTRCRHDNIAILHQHGRHQGHPYQILEYIEGETLRAYLRRQCPPTVESSLELMIPVVRALAYAHRAHLVHRALKPENIMISGAGAIKVLDFGVARLLPRALTADAAANEVPETPETTRISAAQKSALLEALPYMSPEQWRGDEVEPRSDVWAVGVILYELLCGHHPLTPLTPEKLLDVPRHEIAMPSLLAVRPELGRLAEIVDRCSRKRSAERPDAETLLATLMRCAAATVATDAIDTPDTPDPGVASNTISDNTAVPMALDMTEPGGAERGAVVQRSEVLDSEITEPGAIIAERYEIELLASSGGMGSVFKARDLEGKAVALKLLKPGLDHMGGRFFRETRLLMELQHPAIVRYLDSGTTPTKRRFLVMEWLEGVDLQSYLKKQPMPLRDALSLGRRIADALGFVHARGIVHRDIKPNNIFLPGGRVDAAKLLDFGLARWAEAAPLTSTGTQLGTPAYMAPEQIRGAGDIDAAADVFALGCVLYECMTGELAFSGRHAMSVFYKILVEQAPRVSRVASGAPPRVADLIERMLTKERSARPQNGAEVAAALDEILANLPTQLVGHASSRRADSITDTEQQLASVVVVAADPSRLSAPQPSAQTSSRADTQERESDTVARLRRRYHGRSVRFDTLANGSSIAVFESRGEATDLASAAARCALDMSTMSPGTITAVATGRAVVGERLLGDVIERATGLIADALGATPGTDRDTTATPRRAVRLDQVTAGLVAQRFEIERDDHGATLMGERHAPQDTLLGKATPFVGRKREFATLVATLEECVDEEVARMVLVSGPTGSGKSRLAREFLHYLATRPVTSAEPIAVWMARGDPMCVHAPLGVFAEALRHAVGIRQHQSPTSIHDHLAAHVTRSVDAGTDATRLARFLSTIVHAPDPQSADTLPPDSPAPDSRPANAHGDTEPTSDHVQQACVEVLTASCRRQPLVFLLEDLHWCDDATIEVIKSALHRLADAPFLVIALARSEFRTRHPNLFGAHDILDMPIRPLSAHACEQLVITALASDGHDVDNDIGRERIALLVQRAAGNALYLEELVRSAAAGQWQQPATVLAMVHARLEQRTPAARQILRAASVFGERFWPGGVAALVDPHVDVAAGLEELTAEELITPSHSSLLAGETEYEFRHDLIQQAAYGMFVDEDRRLGHKLAGRWLAQFDAIAPQVIAEHLGRGDGD